MPTRGRAAFRAKRGSKKHKQNKTNKKTKTEALGLHPKGQFFKNTVYLERGIPYSVFVDTNAALVRKIDKA